MPGLTEISREAVGAPVGLRMGKSFQDSHSSVFRVLRLAPRCSHHLLIIVGNGKVNCCWVAALFLGTPAAARSTLAPVSRLRMIGFCVHGDVCFSGALVLLA